jgi:D-glycerate 3-kinase
MKFLAILRRLIDNTPLSYADIAYLLAIESLEFNQNNSLILQERAELLTLLWPRIWTKCQELKINSPDQILITCWRFWIPWALQLKNYAKPLIQGILAPQGTGKTTLTSIMSIILAYFDLKVNSLSLDDLYKTYNERLKLRHNDPRLLWRGPPGTHDIELGIKVLEQVCQGESPIFIPRFDKSLHQGQGDRIASEIVERVDILFFEGWFVGMRPVEENLFAHAPDPINTPEDRQFALDNNQRLQEYWPLWSKIDRLLILYPLDYHWSLQWRQSAEPQGGMKKSEIEEFVKYFWKSLHPQLFLNPLIKQADLVVEINQDHSFGKISYQGQVIS